jgi:hypothetical protein
MTGNDLDQNLPAANEGEFWSRWAQALIHPVGQEGAVPEDLLAARDSLDRDLPAAGTLTQFIYPLAYYALPALVARLPMVYAERMLVVWVSDYFRGEPQLEELGPWLAGKHVPKHLGLLREAEAEFGRLYSVQGSLVRLSVDGSPLVKIEVLEVSPLTSPTIYFRTREAEARGTRSGWRLRLPSLEAQGTDPQTPVHSAEAILTEDGTNKTLASPSLNSLRQLSPGQPVHLETVSLDPKVLHAETTATSDAPATAATQATVKLRVSIVYAPQNSFAFHLPLRITTEKLPLRITPPLSFKELLVRILMGLGCLVGLLRFLLGWKPRIEVRTEIREQVPEEERKGAGGAVGIPVLTWVPSARAIPVYIYMWKKARFWDFRSDRARAILEVDDKQACPKLRFYLEPTQNLSSTERVPVAALRSRKPPGAVDPGERVNLGPIDSSSQRVRARVLVDVVDVPEPSVVSAPIALTLFVQVGAFGLRPDAVKLRLTIMFVLAPYPGNFWLGIDPGTTGACIAGGAQLDKLRCVELFPKLTGEQVYIAPSLVYVCRDSEEAERHEGVRRVEIEGVSVPFRAGDDAAPLEGDPDAQPRIFWSAKRLIGYDNLLIPYPEKTPRIKLRGRDGVLMLADYLISRAKDYFVRLPEPVKYKFNQVVLAVPNTFTPAKISQMRACCERKGIERVDVVYEAEAVVMYYLWQTGKLVREEGAGQEIERLRQEGGEYVLVFDLGGGSANFTYAHIHYDPNRKIHVDVKQRLGFAFGGDQLDWEIARILWAGIREHQDYRDKDPFAESPSKEAKKLRFELLGAARDVKTNLAELYAKGDQNSGATRGLARFGTGVYKGPRLSVENMLKDEGIASRLDELEAGMKELIELCVRRKVWKGAHALIWSGRSTRFPGVKERVFQGLKEGKPAEVRKIDLGDQMKTCVAQGAAYRGIMRTQIVLERQTQAFAFYGIRRFVNREGQVEFVSLIAPGMSFKDGHCHRSHGDLDVSYNNREVRLYQVMGANPTESFTNPKKFTRKRIQGVFTVKDQPVDRIDMILTDDDQFDAFCEQDGQQMHQGSEVVVDDIRREEDKSAEWLLK